MSNGDANLTLLPDHNCYGFARNPGHACNAHYLHSRLQTKCPVEIHDSSADNFDGQYELTNLLSHLLGTKCSNYLYLRIVIQTLLFSVRFLPITNFNFDLQSQILRVSRFTPG